MSCMNPGPGRRWGLLCPPPAPLPRVSVNSSDCRWQPSSAWQVSRKVHSGEHTLSKTSGCPSQGTAEPLGAWFPLSEVPVEAGSVRPGAWDAAPRAGEQAYRDLLRQPAPSAPNLRFRPLAPALPGELGQNEPELTPESVLPKAPHERHWQTPCGLGSGPRSAWPPVGAAGPGERAYLITDVQGEDDGEDARGRVPPVALQPAVEDVLDEGRVVYQDLWEGSTWPQRDGGGRAPPPTGGPPPGSWGGMHT